MRQRVIAGLATIIVAGILAGPSMATGPEKVDAPGIVNFSQIDGSSGFAGTTVGCGGATQSSAMPWLKNEGFVSVINLRLASEEGADVEVSRAAAEKIGLNYFHLPFNPQDLSPAVVDAFVAAVGNEESQPVYIHCGSATRAAALWMIGRAREDGWEIAAAGEEARLIATKPEQAITIDSL